MFGGTVAIPLIVAPSLCIADDNVTKGELLGTLLFVSGLVTILQATFGVRYSVSSLYLVKELSFFFGMGVSVCDGRLVQPLCM